MAGGGRLSEANFGNRIGVVGEKGSAFAPGAMRVDTIDLYAHRDWTMNTGEGCGGIRRNIHREHCDGISLWLAQLPRYDMTLNL